MRSTLLTLLVPAMLAVAAAAFAQQPPAPQNTRDALLQGWTDIGEKFVKLAEDFPEDKYDYKPNDAVRTFADTVRHVAFWNQYVAKAARGEKPDGKANELPKAQYATKAAIVAALKSSLADATTELKKFSPTLEPKGAGLISAFAGHTSEHYGQLVVYYRLNKLVPPASRGSN